MKSEKNRHVVSIVGIDEYTCASICCTIVQTETPDTEDRIVLAILGLLEDAKQRTVEAA